jgi:hypothetical protein
MSNSMRWVAACAVGVLVAGCGGKEPEVAQTPYPDGGFVYDAGAFPPPPAATVDAGPPAPTSSPCDSVQTLALTTMLQARQKTEAPGMQPEGAPVCGVVPEGQTVMSTSMVLQPGHCYTILANGLPNVSVVDIQLVADPSAAGLPPALAAMAGNPLLAVSTDAGVQTSIGGSKQGCYQWPWPVPGPVKIVLKARNGSGPIAAQAYSKKK